VTGGWQRSRRAGAPGVIALMAVIALATSVSAATLEEDLRLTRDRLETARAAHLQLIAPRHFEKAEKSLAEAEVRFGAGGKLEDIRKRIDKSRAELVECEALREIGQLLLRDAIEARGDALTSNAPANAPELWAEAEAAILRAGRKVEDGNQNAARKEADRSIHFYREAELRAIRVEVLGSARELRAQAIAGRADELAATTLAGADQLLGEAEQVLTSDRYERTQARKLAESAAEEYRHAARIAGDVRALDEDRKLAPESMIRNYEAHLRRIASVLEFEPYFSEGVAPVTEQIVAAIASLKGDRQNLRTKLGQTQEDVRALEARLAPLEERDAQLRQREERERRLRGVESMFTANEAEVLVSNDQLVVRLYGLSFPSGSAEIRPENFALLTKVMRALREFPKAPVTIEGHTDSQGDESYNQELSQQRANAVREYILANMILEPDWVIAVGYGESRPIASDATAAGRAKNRRIDVLVDLIGI
jgi:outer membrane protein OmpA-like peptidoglycan-associated protein